MKHIVVTGGAGFIGSHLCETLLNRGVAVTAIDNLVTGSRRNLENFSAHPNFHFLDWDVSEPLPEGKIPFLDRYGLAGVLHFACPASPVDFDRIPFEILKVDSVGTFHTVGLALKYKARYVLASTSEIYGDPLEHPQKETYWGNVNTLGPRACYDETKRFAEAVVSTAIRGVGRFANREYAPLNGAIVRIFNTYGPRMRPDDGRVVPELMTRALAGKDLPIHGDGSQTRSFCFVGDLVDGILRVYESDVREAVNLGNPQEMTIFEFAKEIQKLAAKDGAGKKLAILHLNARQDDPRQRRPDITKAKTLLNWQPRVSFDEGMLQTWDYFRSLAR